MSDLVDAVSDDLLEIFSGGSEEGLVQMAKYMGGNGRNPEEKKILTELGIMEAVISNHRHVKLKENQEANLITKSAILKAQETNKIRELCRAIFEFPEKPSEIELRKKKEIETECEFLEESKNVNSADQIDQLNALRCKMQMDENL